MSIKQFVSEFNYWLITEQGMYYRELVVGCFVWCMYLFIIVSDIIAAYLYDSELIIIALFFSWLLYKKTIRVYKLYKNKSWDVT